MFVDRRELKGCKPTLQNKVLFAVAGGGCRHTGNLGLDLGLGLIKVEARTEGQAKAKPRPRQGPKRPSQGQREAKKRPSKAQA